MCHELGGIQEKSMGSFVFPKQLNHIASTKGLVSFGVVQTGFRIRLSSMSSGAGRKSRLFFCKKGWQVPRSVLVLVEEEVFFGGVIGPNVLDGVVGLLVVLDLLEVFYHL